MCPHRSVELLVADCLASAGTVHDRAESLLDVLRRTVAFDGAWLAVTDPAGPGYHSLASVDLPDEMVHFLSGPVTARDIEITGTDRNRPPLSPSDLPYPAEELSTWADCLMPSGIHEALAVALFAGDGRHVGFLALLSGARTPPSAAVRHELQRIAPLLAQVIDPMRSIVAAARLVRGATAGVVLGRDGSYQPLPGLGTHVLLAPGSPALRAGRDRIVDRRPFSTFLWPLGGAHAPGGHVRVTVLAVPDDATSGTTAVALLSPATDLRGLTPREFEVLGLLVEGCSNHEIARALMVAPRTVAAHLEHVLVKLDAPTRTLAAVRAERDGLFVPVVRGARSAAVGRGTGSDADARAGHGRSVTPPFVSSSSAAGHLDRTEAAAAQATRARTASTVHTAPRSVATMADQQGFDAVFGSPHACSVLDDHGEVLAVNDAWVAFAGKPVTGHTGVGANYLDVCRRAMQQGAPRAEEAHAVLAAVVARRAMSGSVVYPCAVPSGLRWFRGDFFATSQPGRIGVRHVDVTDQLAPAPGPGVDELLGVGARTLNGTGLLLALGELMERPFHPAVVVMVSDLGARPRGAAGDRSAGAAAVLTTIVDSGVEFEVVGRLSHDVVAVVVAAEEPHAAMRAADAVISASSYGTPAMPHRWGLAVRTAADDAGSVLARARRSLLRTTGDGSIDDAARRSQNLHDAAAALVEAVAEYDQALVRGVPMVELVGFDRVVQRSEVACASAASPWQ